MKEKNTTKEPIACGGEHFRQWGRTILVLFLLVALSIVLLLWTHRLGERHRDNHVLLNALMDVQIHAAKFHLWLEKYLEDDRTIDIMTAGQDMEECLRQLNAILSGGMTEHGLIRAPLVDPDFRAQAEDIKSLLVKFKESASERLRDPAKSRAGSEADRRFDEIFETILTRAFSLETSIQGVNERDHLKAERLFWSILFVWILVITFSMSELFTRQFRRTLEKAASGYSGIGGAHSAERNEAESGKKSKRITLKSFYHSPFRIFAVVVLSIFGIEACVMVFLQVIKPMPFIAEAVLDSTILIFLLSPILYFFLLRPLLLHLTERRHAEAALQKVSSQILSAQERERERISKELHDDLGQALNLLKLRTTFVERRLSEGQAEEREECGRILDDLDRVIENVRCLSHDLCPTALEDLGLTPAVELLADDFAKHCLVETSVDVDDIGDLFTHEARVFIYRVLQEAITNIGKHAGAQHVSITIKRRDSAVFFSVEDNGKGFDLKEVAGRPPSEKGMGLSAMSQRIQMLGGIFEVWSKKGHGTKILFSLPAGGEGST